MTALINESALQELVKQQVKKQLALTNYEMWPRTEGLTPRVRKGLFHGKGTEWIRTFIFDKYPEVNELNGGWVINPRKTPQGKTTSICIKPAIKWLDKHEREIDWNAKLPS